MSNVQVGQYVVIKPPSWTHPIFGRVERIVLIQAHPIVVYVDKFWGKNGLAKFVKENSKKILDVETNEYMEGMYINCPRDGIIEIDWYHDFYLKVVEHKRRGQWEVDMYKTGRKREKLVGRDMRPAYAQEAELMAETYRMVGMQINWEHHYNEEYDKQLASKDSYANRKAAKEEKRILRIQKERGAAERKKKKAEAKIPKKGDLVIVSNVQGYGKNKYEMIVAAVGPTKFQEGDMIRDLLWDNGNQLVPLTFPASYVGPLGGTQALAFYTEDFPKKLLFSIVQWTRPKNRNFIKKIPPPAAATTEEPMQVELKL